MASNLARAAAIFLPLAPGIALSALRPDWLERLGLAPDGGSGVLELFTSFIVIGIGLAISAFVLGRYVRPARDAAHF